MSEHSTPTSTPTNNSRKRAIALVGQRFGKLLVTGLGRPGYVLVECDCGKVKEFATADVRSRYRSCGCARRKPHTHGKSRTREHRIWLGIKARCQRPGSTVYAYYGARGIKLCDRWQSFENFYADMGDCPAGMSIERLDNEKGYEPGNCVWADRLTQANNKRTSKFITARGETLTVAQWARRLGISKRGIYRNLWKGLTGEEALVPPYIRRQGKSK